MSYIKLKGTQLFTGEKLLDDSYVLIMNNDGTVETIISSAEAGEDIQIFEGIISPGLINSHCHLELSNLKGLIPENSGMVDFLLGVMKHREENEEVIIEAMNQADQLMHDRGIVAVGDISNLTISAGIKEKSTLYYHTFLELTGINPAIADRKIETGLTALSVFKQLGLTASLSPHAPYSVSNALLSAINVQTAGHIVSMHNQESVPENLLFKKGEGDFMRLFKEIGLPDNCFKHTGTTSLQSWLQYFDRKQTMILVHNVTTDRDDLLFVSDRLKSEETSLEGVYLCLCTLANHYIQRTSPHPEIMIEHHDNIVIGTDSLASNHTLCVWTEILALKEQNPHIPLETMLKWGTINGARALRIDDKLGSFEKGKAPGITVLNGNNSKKILL